jgi:hypothetical protein
MIPIFVLSHLTILNSVSSNALAGMRGISTLGDYNGSGTLAAMTVVMPLRA